MEPKTSKTSVKNEAVQQNIAFIYGRNSNEQLHDLDKRIYVKSVPKLDEKRIDNFTGDYFFLSPIYLATTHLFDEKDDMYYPSFEHALHASKFKVNDGTRDQIRNISDIREVKRKFKINPTEEWKENCLQIGEKLLRDKFIRHKQLRSKLMKTVDYLIVYKNDLGDNFWGVGPNASENCDKKDYSNKLGQNHLGKLYQKIRKEIETGDDLDKWLQQTYDLLPCEKVSMQVNVYNEINEIVIGKTKEFRRYNVVILGKTDESDYIVEHASVSRVHAAVIADRNRGTLLVDLGSSNGTTVNGVRINPFEGCSLDSDSVVHLGACKQGVNVTLNTQFDILQNQMLVEKIVNPDVNSAKRDDEYTVFVRQISKQATEQDLTEFFSICGKIKKLVYPVDKLTTLPKGIAFITFENSSGFIQAISRDNDVLLDEPIRIKRNEPQPRQHLSGHRPSQSQTTYKAEDDSYQRENSTNDRSDPRYSSGRSDPRHSSDTAYRSADSSEPHESNQITAHLSPQIPTSSSVLVGSCTHDRDSNRAGKMSREGVRRERVEERDHVDRGSNYVSDQARDTLRHMDNDGTRSRESHYDRDKERMSGGDGDGDIRHDRDRDRTKGRFSERDSFPDRDSNKSRERKRFSDRDSNNDKNHEKKGSGNKTSERGEVMKGDDDNLRGVYGAKHRKSSTGHLDSSGEVSEDDVTRKQGTQFSMKRSINSSTHLNIDRERILTTATDRSLRDLPRALVHSRREDYDQNRDDSPPRKRRVADVCNSESTSRTD